VNPWLAITIAGLLEVVWAIGLKSSSTERPLILVGTLAALAGSMGFLALGLRSLPVGTAYAVWTGIGAVGTAIIGVVVLREPATWPRFAGVALIVAGIAVLRLSAKG
jgi:quaternary ammonium compound-resistance protein SugE